MADLNGMIDKKRRKQTFFLSRYIVTQWKNFKYKINKIKINIK